MTKKQKHVSAIAAIIQPFQFKSKSTQTVSEPHDIRVGGREYTVSVFNKKKGEWESITRHEGGQVLSVTYRIRTGKTKREKAKLVKVTSEKEVTLTRKSNKFANLLNR